MKKKRNLYKTATILLLAILVLIVAGAVLKNVFHQETDEVKFVSANPGFYGWISGPAACGSSGMFNYASGGCEPPYEPWNTQACH